MDSVGRVVVGGYIVSGATLLKDGIWQFTGLLPMVNPLAEGVPERTVCGGPPVGRDCKDGFLMVLDAEGRSLLLSSPLAGKSDDSVAKIQFDPSGNLYAFGHGMQGFRLPGTPDGASFVVKIEPVGPPPLAKGAALVNSAD